MDKPMSFEEYRAERQALGERMDADDARIRECDREGDREWNVGNAEGAKYFENSAKNADKDLHATAEKEQALDRDYWGGVEKERTAADGGAEVAAAEKDDYWSREEAGKDAGQSARAEAAEERQADAGAEKENETENSL